MQPILPSRRVRPAMAGNPWVVEAQTDEFDSLIDEEVTAKVIGMSFHR